ncbi:MAG: multidrug ABC transporter permease, partial [Henriciella sp.]
KGLDEHFQTAAHFDPIFYLIDGFRAGFIGVSNSDLGVGFIASGIFTFLACVWVWWLFRIGYKLKA